jgi:MraZ protein
VDKSPTSQSTEKQASPTPDQGIWGSEHTLFLGEYSHKVDDKGRLALPAKFRAGLSQGAVLTRGADKSLYLYSIEQWKPQAEKLAALPAWSSPEARELQRTVLGGATAVTPDKQGRVLLPGNLREYAGLDSTKTTEVVVAGLYGRIEIHPADRWKAARQATDLEKIAPKLADLGI